MRLIDLHDRYGRSFIVGLLASLVQYGLNQFSYYILHFSNRRFLNWAGILIFGRKETNIVETLISSIATIGFATTLIIIYAKYFIKIGCKNYILRGLNVGLGTWFAIMTFSYLSGIERIIPIIIPSTITLMVTSAIWGIMAAYLLHVFDARYTM